jgi:periplasmic protein TonB
MAHADILDQGESLRKPLIASAVFHVSFLALAAVYTLWMGHVGQETWGSASGGEGAVQINAVRTIPIPGKNGHLNPLAHDTESQIPEPPPDKKPEKAAPKEQPDAIPLWRDKPVHQQLQAVARRNLPPQQYRENQIYSVEGQAAASPMYSMPHGGGSIGVGVGAFGQQYGAYVNLIIQRIEEKWQTTNLDPRSQRTPAFVNFEIRRDGSVSTPTVMQSSGNYNIDVSARRAVLMAAPFPPLPPQYGRDSASVEVRFNLR